MNDTTDKMQQKKPGQYRPSLLLYHPTMKNTGSAIKMTLHPAHDDTAGSIMLTMANQLTIGDRRGSNPTFSRFDWEDAITVKLDFDDLSKLLQVFRGECESIADGKGLFHSTAQFTTTIRLRHLIEPFAGYSLELFRSSRSGGDESRASFLMTPSEALGISLAIEDSLGVVAFGIPMLVAHDTTQYRRESREFRNAAAA
ncbi:MAG: hypothetical protein IKO55_09340 [Kiritimatiellae bacterium]|jgi:hypothetical protein|nr:hypothetical protein [Kiritimatiellia bacterium]